jgi:hypothetical protein
MIRRALVGVQESAGAHLPNDDAITGAARDPQLAIVVLFVPGDDREFLALVGVQPSSRAELVQRVGRYR